MFGLLKVCHSWWFFWQGSSVLEVIPVPSLHMRVGLGDESIDVMSNPAFTTCVMRMQMPMTLGSHSHGGHHIERQTSLSIFNATRCST